MIDNVEIGDLIILKNYNNTSKKVMLVLDVYEDQVLKCTKGTSNKFYIIKKRAKGVAVEYGRIGTSGSTGFYTSDNPEKEANKIYKQKINKGYHFTGRQRAFYVSEPGKGKYEIDSKTITSYYHYEVQKSKR